MANGNDIQEKIKKILGEAKSCALLTEQNPNEEPFLLKNVFGAGLESLGISAISLPEIGGGQNADFKKKWRPLLENRETATPEFQTKTIIKIPKKILAIKELSYNEDENFFSLVITPKNGRLTKDVAIFEEALPEPEAIFCFFEEKEKLDNFKNLIISPAKENIFFLVPGENSLTEKIAGLFQFLNINFSPFILNTLFSALIIETNNFKDYSNKEIFSLANFLLSRGANGNLIKEVAEKEKTNSFIQLFGRMLARTYYDEALNVSWSFLGKRDFEKTKTEPNSNFILKIVKEMEAFGKCSEISVCCFQKENGVFAFLKALEKSLLLNLAQKLNTSLQSDYIIAGPFKNFSEAEIKIKEILN